MGCNYALFNSDHTAEKWDATSDAINCGSPANTKSNRLLLLKQLSNRSVIRKKKNQNV